MPTRPAARPLLWTLLALVLPAALAAQVLAPVKWAFTVEQDAGKTYLVHRATIAEGWTVYSQYLESDDGPVATAITYDDLGGATLRGTSAESGGKTTGFDDIFRMNVTKFKREYAIRQEVAGLSAKPVSGYLTYMVCDKTQCLPPTDVDFRFVATANASAAPASAKTTPTPTAPDRSLAPGITPAPAPGTTLTPRPDRGGAQVDPPARNPPGTPAPAVPSVGAPGVAPGVGVGAKSPSASADNPVFDAINPGDAVVPGGAEPVTWTFATRRLDDSTYALTATAAIAPGWNIYAQDVADGGPIPTTFHFDATEGVRLDGAVTEAGTRKAGIDPVFGVHVAKLLAPTATFEQRVVLRDPGATVTGYLEFMSCDQEQCLPPQDVRFVYVPARGLARAGTQAELAGGPAVSPGAGDPISAYRIDKSGEQATCGNEITASVAVGAKDGLAHIFLLGFGGGLLALLTPCVFPMIPLTVSFFTGRGKDRKRGVRRALLYGASIIAIYVGLGLLVTSVFGADALNAFSTDPWVNIGFGILFVVFALSFFGVFELNLPSSWANRTDRAADRGGLLGIFFMAFTLSLVSFSCTGPIIGTLLVETASGGGRALFGHIPVAPLVGMLGFSVALALPFTLFAAFPSALQALPKSGGWMDAVKVTLGIAEIAFAMKFFSTADLILGTKWMPYELFLAVWVLCATALVVYYLIVMPRRARAADKPGFSLATVGLGAVAVALVAYLGLGFRYDPVTRTFDTPGALSGLAPPAGHSYVYEKVCPRDFDCFKDYDEGLAYARSVGKPILLDFTGHGCVNCRRMEDQVWGQPGVHERIKEDYVLVSLYVDERTELAEPFVSDYSGRKLRTVGNKWADFQARTFDRNSQPYYVLLSPDERVLTQPVPYTPDVEEYAAFLNCGLSQFRKLEPAPVGALGSR